MSFWNVADLACFGFFGVRRAVVSGANYFNDHIYKVYRLNELQQVEFQNLLDRRDDFYQIYQQPKFRFSAWMTLSLVFALSYRQAFITKTLCTFILLSSIIFPEASSGNKVKWEESEADEESDSK
jgi:hypothetical protein